MTTPELFQFQFSHYNEKARWALDFKRLAHVRRTLLPGPHAISVPRLSGQKSVPVLRVGTTVIAGSNHIIAYLEEHHPEPRLYPEDERERQRALEIQRWFDDEVGPPIRRAFFFELLADGAYSARLFTLSRGPAARAVYRALFPAIRLAMKKDMQLDAAGAARGRQRTLEALDFVASNAGPDGHLVGGRFSVADLTAAALLSPTVLPAQFAYRLPEPRAKVLDHWLAHWTGHPGTRWVESIFARHRGAAAEVPA